MDAMCHCAVNEPDHQWVHGYQHTVTALTYIYLVPDWRHKTSLVFRTAEIPWSSCDQIQHGSMVCPVTYGASRGKSQSGMRPFVSLALDIDRPLADLHASVSARGRQRFLFFGPKLGRFDCQAAFSTEHSSLEGLVARCMPLHFMPSSRVPCIRTFCKSMSTYTDPFTSSCLLASATLGSYPLIDN